MSRFSKIREAAASRVLLASHRGIYGGNIPPNSMTSFEIALKQGTDIMELDLAKSTDGDLFVYHPTTENRWLLEAQGRNIETFSSAEIRAFHLSASDGSSTFERVPEMDDMLELLKNKCYINLDKCWTCLPEVVKYVGRHGMKEQILLKSSPKDAYLSAVEELAPDYAYLPIIKEKDGGVYEKLSKMKVNFIGAELVFATEESEVAAEEYRERFHKDGKILWGNAILYNSAVPLSAGHSDDRSLAGDPAGGWGWLADRGFDIIQTDWCAMAKSYLTRSGKIYKKQNR